MSDYTLEQLTRIENARKKARLFGFESHFNLIEQYNPSNDAPYHNWFHTCCMVDNCVDAAIYHGMNFRDIHLLGVSALYHDANHSMGYETDDRNIERALKFLGSPNSLTPLDLGQVRACIQVTQFPYVLEPLTLDQKIIRDCDLLQILEPDWFDHVVLGLQAEFENSGRSVSLKDMLEGQLKFMDSHINPDDMYTEWASNQLNTLYRPDQGSLVIGYFSICHYRKYQINKKLEELG